MKKVFVDKDINIFEDEVAEKKLNEKNDKKYVIENVGIPRVDKIRWEEAQYYERKTWCDSPAKYMGTDRNEFHEKYFGGYEQLNFHLNHNLNIIELGCGPFTNLRLIIPKIFKHINNIDLVDPLIYDYIKHTINCTYTQGNLCNHKINIYNTSIEEFILEKKYDIVVMINVIEHCFDIDLIFKKINDMLSKDGIFIFHDKFLQSNDISTIHDRYYDSGHPLKISYDYIKNIINNYRVLYNNTYINENNEKCVYSILKKQ